MRRLYTTCLLAFEFSVWHSLVKLLLKFCRRKYCLTFWRFKGYSTGVLIVLLEKLYFLEQKLSARKNLVMQKSKEEVTSVVTQVCYLEESAGWFDSKGEGPWPTFQKQDTPLLKITQNHRLTRQMDEWRDFTPFSAVFQLYQDDEMLITKGCVHRTPFTVEKISSWAGLELGTARSQASA